MRYQHLVDLQKPIKATSSLAQITWEKEKSFFASLTPVSAMEANSSGFVIGQFVYQIKTHFDSAITTYKRIKFGSRIFNISSVINVNERNKEMTIAATEVIE